MLKCTGGASKRADGSDAPFATMTYTVHSDLHWSEEEKKEASSIFFGGAKCHQSAAPKLSRHQAIMWASTDDSKTHYKFVYPMCASAPRSEVYRPEAAAQLAHRRDALDALSTTICGKHTFHVSDWFAIGTAI